MSGFTSFASGSGANQNLDNTYERLGQGAVGVGSACTAGAGSKGTGASIGTTSSAWSGFWIYVQAASTSNNRYLVDISNDNGSTWFVSNLYIEPNGSAPVFAIFVPLNVAAASVMTFRAQGNGAGTVRVWLMGVVTNSQSPPMFSSMTALNVDTTNTRPGQSDLTMVASGSTTFSEIEDSTVATYGALMAVVGGPTTGAVTTSQATLLNIGTGAAASETIIGALSVYSNSGSAASFRSQAPLLLYKTIASGSRLSVQMLSTTQGANDLYQCGLYGFAV